MKDDVIKGVLIVAAFSAASYWVVKHYQKKQEIKRRNRDYIHFQLF